MAIEDRKRREREAQRLLIVDTARRLAESDGWDAVTTRRLSTEIEYSQPVIYKHFASLEDLCEEVALESFDELTVALREAREKAPSGRVLNAVAEAYLGYAEHHPALYDAMFTRSTRLPFARPDTPTALRAAFAELSTTVTSVAGERDLATLTEVFWASLHGLVSLQRSGRLRPDEKANRVRVLVTSIEGPHRS
jgi:AcrR family transcriptional regulator